MADRVYPSSKPTTATNTTATAAAATIPNPPAAKSQFHNPTRHPYRPTPTTRHPYRRKSFSCRRCCCLTCFWSILILLILLLVAATAAAAFYALYHPRRPLFSVTSLKIAAFNLTTTPADDSTRLTAKINVTLSAKNPNKRITYIYDPMSITIQSNSAVALSNGSFANFTSSAAGITVIHTTMAMNNQILDADSVNSIKSDLKKKNGIPMEIVMDTMVGVKMEKLKMKKVGIRVTCDGIHGSVPRGKTVIPANTARAKCKVDLRIKILKWTF